MVITPAALIKRLMDVYGATSQEDLARHLGVPVRRVQDYKAGKGMRFDRTIDLLQRAGWLSTAADAPAGEVSPRDPLERLAASFARLEIGQATILELLTQQQSQSQAPGRRRPKAPKQM